MSLPRSLVWASFGILAVGAPVLVACSGKTLSLGTNTTGSQLVAPSAVSGPVPACGTNAAHPNVCCTAGPNQAASCVTYPDAPFTQCTGGATTYPDPRSCCPVDGSGPCAPPPPPAPLDASPGGGGGGGGSPGCDYACPPGSYVPPNASPGECCTTDSSGATSCGAPASGGSCTCPACAPNEPCPPCNCPAQPAPNPVCPACPPGWQVPQGDPSLCCMTDPNGVIECFSQAGPPGSPGPTPTPADAGPAPGGPSGSCFASGSVDGALGPCGCQEQAGGHTYEVDCDPNTKVCSCIVDNGAPQSTYPDSSGTCGDPATMFASCGFPAN